MTGKEAKKRVVQQYKRQNEHIKNNYDRISITLPKGTKERILQKEESINGYVSRLIMQDLGKDN
jgi:lipase chaperone LimK